MACGGEAGFEPALSVRLQQPFQHSLRAVNPCNIGGPPPERVDVSNDLTTVREPEIKVRADEMQRRRGRKATQYAEEGSEGKHETDQDEGGDEFSGGHSV